MRRNMEREATIVAKYAAISRLLDERARRIWAATESLALGYGGDALVSSATGLARATIRQGRRELEAQSAFGGRIRKAGAWKTATRFCTAGNQERPRAIGGAAHTR